MSDHFDVWLEQQLSEGYARLGRRPARPFRTGRLPRLGLALPGALSAKALTGLAVAALAAGGGAAVTHAGGVGAFGQSVSDRAAACVKDLSAGGVGECVSDIVVATNPGAAHRSPNAQPGGASQGAPTAPGQASQSAASAHSDGHATPNPHDTGNKPNPRGAKP